jgi:predicted flap endonuclease-1-like 5' DNA nuclease
MAYLIDQLIWWLLGVVVLSAVAGWAVHAFRTEAKDDQQLRERDRVLRELLNASGDAPSNGADIVHIDRTEFLQRQADLNTARIAELEASLEAARSRAEEAAGRVVELERGDERATADLQELNALRGRVASLEQSQLVEVQPVAANDDDAALQAWRLRYFEQRVRYLETQQPVALALPAPEAAPEPEPAPAQATDIDMAARWSARYFAARTEYLEKAARDAAAATLVQLVAEVAPVEAPSVELQEMLRWRMRYLEKRVEYLQAQPVAAPPSDGVDHELDSARFKWRARYLEARVRHLESRPQLVAAPATEPVVEAPAPEPIAAVAEPVRDERPTPAPLVPAGSEERPPALPAARQGAPDDLSLIDGVTVMQQSTLNSLGIYHFDQIAAWTPANVAWVDQYLRLRGRISEYEWVEQAAILAREGPLALKRAFDHEPA